MLGRIGRKRGIGGRGVQVPAQALVAGAVGDLGLMS